MTIMKTLFEAVDRKNPSTFSLVKPKGVTLPDGSAGSRTHQQGIQRTVRGEFAVSGSASEHGYIYLTDPQGVVVYVIEPDYRNAAGEAYNHAGGFQIADDVLVVGYERREAGAAGTSKVLFYDVADVACPVPLAHLTISRDMTNSTAGAVAMTPYQGTWLVLVANFDAARLDFYRSATVDLRDPTNRFTPTSSWAFGVNGLDATSIDRKWAKYQNINLFTQPGDDAGPESLWFVAMHDNWADLYRLDDDQPVSRVTKVDGMQFELDGTSFQNGSGYVFDATKCRFEVYACEKHLGDTTHCNRWM
jgi:hypothetical protein